jgi:hypothetical protein
MKAQLLGVSTISVGAPHGQGLPRIEIAVEEAVQRPGPEKRQPGRKVIEGRRDGLGFGKQAGR